MRNSILVKFISLEVVVLRFEVDKAVTERCVRRASASLHSYLYLIQASRWKNAAFVWLVACLVVRTSRAGSLVALYYYAGKVWHRRWSPELASARNYIINHYPAVIATCEDPVYIFVVNAANVLESSA